MNRKVAPIAIGAFAAVSFLFELGPDGPRSAEAGVATAGVWGIRPSTEAARKTEPKLTVHGNSAIDNYFRAQRDAAQHRRELFQWQIEEERAEAEAQKRELRMRALEQHEAQQRELAGERKPLPRQDG